MQQKNRLPCKKIKPNQACEYVTKRNTAAKKLPYKNTVTVKKKNTSKMPITSQMLHLYKFAENYRY